jgi:hypothetical protein
MRNKKKGSSRLSLLMQLSAFWMRFPSLLVTGTVLLDTPIYLKLRHFLRILFLRYSVAKKTRQVRSNSVRLP